MRGRQLKARIGTAVGRALLPPIGQRSTPQPKTMHLVVRDPGYFLPYRSTRSGSVERLSFVAPIVRSTSLKVSWSPPEVRQHVQEPVDERLGSRDASCRNSSDSSPATRGYSSRSPSRSRPSRLRAVARIVEPFKRIDRLVARKPIARRQDWRKRSVNDAMQELDDAL